jgi:hypothetical protein
MAVFDPNDWRDWNAWFQSDTQAKQRRRPEEVNREVVSRWLGAVALCLCFAALAPSGQVGVAFGGLLIVAALASTCLAAISREPFHSPHLTPWDEAILSAAAGLALVAWLGPPGLGAA